MLSHSFLKVYILDGMFKSPCRSGAQILLNIVVLVLLFLKLWPIFSIDLFFPVQLAEVFLAEVPNTAGDVL